MPLLKNPTKALSAIPVSIWLLLLTLGLFWWFPNLDLLLSQLFYNPATGFAGADHPVATLIYNYTNYLGYGILLGLPLAMTGMFIYAKTQASHAVRKYMNQKVIAYLFLCALAGPVLLVDAVMKKSWDRPRPKQVELFGGPYAYEPPLSPAFICDECESFVSGHAAVGFYLFSIALLLRKKRWYAGTLILAGTIGFARIIQGGHFLSDVVFSGFIVWFSCWFLYCLFTRQGWLPEQQYTSPGA